MLSDGERDRDPLLAAADELAILRARSPEHARELAEWTGRMMPFFGVTETEEESRYRQAACLLADISWRAHPDYRGLQALNVIAHSSFVGITHAGRAFIALTNYYRFEGLNDDGATGPLATIATQQYLDRAKLLGGLLRVVYLFSASMPGVVRNLTFRQSSSPDFEIEFVVPPCVSRLCRGAPRGPAAAACEADQPSAHLPLRVALSIHRLPGLDPGSSAQVLAQKGSFAPPTRRGWIPAQGRYDGVSQRKGRMDVHHPAL